MGDLGFVNFVTAVVAGMPGRMKAPTPQPGETMLQCAIRANPRAWKDCVAALVAAHGLTKDVRNQLLAGRFDGLTMAVRAEVERFANRGLPTTFRTLEALATLRDSLKSDSSVRILRILWPRELPPAGHAEGEAKAEEARKLAESLGVTIVPLPHGSPPTLDLAQLGSHTNGSQAIWMVSGGTLPCDRSTLRGALAVMDHGGPYSGSCGLYSDNVASFIVRAGCIRSIDFDANMKLRPVVSPADPAALAKLITHDNLVALTPEDPDDVLTHLEPEFGGWTKQSRSRQGKGCMTASAMILGAATGFLAVQHFIFSVLS